MSQANLIEKSRTVMSVIMQPGDANFLGKVFGGKLLSLIDLCAYQSAARYSGEACVTASFDQVDFLEPIEVGEVVTLQGRVTFVGRSSMEITIEVEAENLLSGERRRTNVARVTMVAIRDGKPVPVPKFVPVTESEKRDFVIGRLRREQRPIAAAEREALANRVAGLGDEALDELLMANSLLEALSTSDA